ncbi:heavy metal translocating P-type ATPase [Chitinophaga oryzae]|uniref:P-type Zn(2+) transporter n=1 Tax=Chitinophaga oryzae TaxID=2725414 RepID=A0AAE6ZCG3_9BACT|nr:heavy metal translocating P-type ATPase [Chitinophaga oryzae]QJB30019.1 heavy metal translocating P-type ATPase [Chitinophaga oryzae]QJB36516.1 heavy metal translocating P-type ATPase [Chitinophaga oryzae]
MKENMTATPTAPKPAHACDGGHQHKPGEKHDHNHDHDHGHAHTMMIFGKNTELYFSLLCGATLAIAWILGRTLVPAGTMSEGALLPILIASYVFGGFYTAKEAIETISKGGFEIDFLMLVAAAGAAMLGKWEEGALLLFLFSLGHSLEHYAMEKARKSITALADLAPKTALLKTGSGTKEVDTAALKAGDIIVVKPNTKISADGIVVAGTSSVDQAPITGESVPVDKTPVDDPSSALQQVKQLNARNKVFSGSINGNGSLEIMVSQPASDSTISRLVKMVNEAQSQKSPTQQFTDRFQRIFVPAVLILVLLLCFAFLVLDEPFSASFYRAMSVLVAASPCALAISTPSAVLSGVARAARMGVLIKGGRPLEDLGNLTAVAFDKTGTLTEGKPKLTNVLPMNGHSETDLLQAAVAVEALSDHPLAKAIVRDGKAKLGNTAFPEAQQLEAVLGKGIKATWQGAPVYIGNLALFQSLDQYHPSPELIADVQELERGGHTTMVVRKGTVYAGIISVMDTPRPEAAEVLKTLKNAGIRRMIMLTGDNQQVADAVAKQTGLTDAWGNLLPEQKVEAIQKLARDEHKVAMVGDGVNDAPAMANSTVGIAMGAAGSDVALETADIALMGDKLTLLPFAIGLSRTASRIIKQNLWMSLGMVAILIPLTITGIASIGPAVMAHEGSTLVVVFNGLRLLAYNKKIPGK